MACPQCGHAHPTEARFCPHCGAAVVTTVAPLPAVPSPGPPAAVPVADLELAGFWRRCGAWLIDGVILIIGLALTFYLPGPGRLPVFVLPWVYHWLFTGIKGQTPGKMLLGIKVVDRRGNPPSLGAAALREIVGKILSSIVLYLGFLWVLWDRQQQGWHDQLAGTYVVQARR
ncbi:MAG: hypothetical protein CL878_05790 [Dehalococcoidia bacterium]|nr:hypothetical protein [Dehalococcoidia bacterium]